MRTVDEIMAAAFNVARMPRSIPYKMGCRALLERKATGRLAQCPFPEGSAERDAYYAGVDEGWSLWKEATGDTRRVTE